jgi:hypothetical protein
MPTKEKGRENKNKDLQYLGREKKRIKETKRKA